MNILARSPIKSCEMSAIIMRAAGYREDLGRIAYWDRNVIKRVAYRVGWRKTPGGLFSAAPFLMMAEHGMSHADRAGLFSLIPLALLPAAILQVNAGRAIVTARLLNNTQVVPTFQGWGTATGTTGQTDTALFFETYSTTNDGSHNQRPSGTQSQVLTSTANDTYKVITTMTAAQAQNGTQGTLGGPISNAGLFDALGTSASLITAPTGANLYMKGDFAILNLSSGDSIQFSSTVQYS